MSNDSQLLGELGERIAERWLTRKGWRLLGRRFRNGHRDIDLIVEGQNTVVFVEVKARHSGTIADPTLAVDWRKQRELIRSAQVWMDRFGVKGRSYRFDVVGVLVDGKSIRVRHVENAFFLRGSV